MGKKVMTESEKRKKERYENDIKIGYAHYLKKYAKGEDIDEETDEAVDPEVERLRKK